MAVLIFANGDMNEVAWTRPYLADATAVIAANGGSRHLYRLERSPDALIGDMDSLPDEVRDWLQAEGIEPQTYPRAKDETDLELALLYAAGRYPDEPLIVFGAFGGRFDQTLANVLLLGHPRLAGHAIALHTRHERIWLLDGRGLEGETRRTAVHGEIGDTLSLIPLGGDVHVIRTAGLRWPLRDELLRFGPARGVSNELTAEEATVEVGSGTLLCIHTSQAWGR